MIADVLSIAQSLNKSGRLNDLFACIITNFQAVLSKCHDNDNIGNSEVLEKFLNCKEYEKNENFANNTKPKQLKSKWADEVASDSEDNDEVVLINNIKVSNELKMTNDINVKVDDEVKMTNDVNVKVDDEVKMINDVNVKVNDEVKLTKDVNVKVDDEVKVKRFENEKSSNDNIANNRWQNVDNKKYSRNQYVASNRNQHESYKTVRNKEENKEENDMKNQWTCYYWLKGQIKNDTRSCNKGKDCPFLHSVDEDGYPIGHVWTKKENSYDVEFTMLLNTTLITLIFPPNGNPKIYSEKMTIDNKQ